MTAGARSHFAVTANPTAEWVAHHFSTHSHGIALLGISYETVTAAMDVRLVKPQSG
jgi:hypothetical protein